MDADEQAKLEGAKREIQNYLNLPITREILQSNKEAQDSLLSLVLDYDVTNIETLVSHFVAIGHLRGLRAAHKSMMDRLSEIQDNLANAKD